LSVADRSWLRAGFAIALAVACASGTAVRAQGDGQTELPSREAARRDGPPRLEPLRVLGAVDPDRAMSPDEARALQESVRLAREDAADALGRERAHCYRQFFVNACLSDVGQRERLVRARLDRLEVAANRTLREHTALELNERAAADLARRATDASDEAARRDENRRAYEARQVAAQAEQAQREAQAPELARQAEANRVERARREAENAARRREAEVRAQQDAPNAAARARELEARRLEREAGDARELERREARRDERERSDEAARRRAETPPAPRRPGAKSPAAVPPVSGPAAPGGGSVPAVPVPSGSAGGAR
jgi:hypothetical protein